MYKYPEVQTKFKLKTLSHLLRNETTKIIIGRINEKTLSIICPDFAKQKITYVLHQYFAVNL